MTCGMRKAREVVGDEGATLVRTGRIRPRLLDFRISAKVHVFGERNAPQRRSTRGVAVESGLASARPRAQHPVGVPRSGSRFPCPTAPLALEHAFPRPAKVRLKAALGLPERAARRSPCPRRRAHGVRVLPLRGCRYHASRPCRGRPHGERHTPTRAAPRQAAETARCRSAALLADERLWPRRLDEVGCESECFAQVLHLEIRIVRQDFCFRHAVGEHGHDRRNGDPHTPNARDSAHLIWALRHAFVAAPGWNCCAVVHGSERKAAWGVAQKPLDRRSSSESLAAPRPGASYGSVAVSVSVCDRILIGYVYGPKNGHGAPKAAHQFANPTRGFRGACCGSIEVGSGGVTVSRLESPCPLGRSFFSSQPTLGLPTRSPIVEPSTRPSPSRQ